MNESATFKLHSLQRESHAKQLLNRLLLVFSSAHDAIQQPMICTRREEHLEAVYTFTCDNRSVNMACHRNSLFFMRL